MQIYCLIPVDKSGNKVGENTSINKKIKIFFICQPEFSFIMNKGYEWVWWDLHIHRDISCSLLKTKYSSLHHSCLCTVCTTLVHSGCQGNISCCLLTPNQLHCCHRHTASFQALPHVYWVHNRGITDLYHLTMTTKHSKYVITILPAIQKMKRMTNMTRAVKMRKIRDLYNHHQCHHHHHGETRTTLQEGHE